MNLPSREKFWYPDHFLCGKCTKLTDKLTLFNDEHLNSHLLDCFSFWHIIGGILLGLILKRVDYVILVNLLFEFIENTHLGVSFWIQSGVSNKHEYDTYINIIGDTLCVMAGFYISRKGLRVSIYAAILLLILFFTVPMFLEKSETRNEIRNIM